jgi:REP element-mobilizing transposase RayT
MRRFKSKQPNLVHYVTGVTRRRVPIFRNEHACLLFIEALATTRQKEPFKLIGYVLMPDHFHLLANPLCLDISVIAGRLKGRAASLILAWLRNDQHLASLAKLELARPLKSGQTHAVWQEDFSDIDVWSRKFIRQNLSTYITILSVPVWSIIRASGVGRVIERIFRINRAMSL